MLRTCSEIPLLAAPVSRIHLRDGVLRLITFGSGRTPMYACQSMRAVESTKALMFISRLRRFAISMMLLNI